MVSVSTFSWLFFIGLSLFVTGRYFQDYTTGILGGFFIFLLGVSVFMSPLVGIDSWFNIVVGSVLFGLGAYIWVRGSIEAVDGGGFL